MQEVAYKVQEGDLLCVGDKWLLQRSERQPTTIPKPANPVIASSAPLESSLIVFENEHVLVLDKPSGMPCQLGTGIDPKKTPSVIMLVHAYLKEQGNDESERGYLVHRLDQVTSGLMCVAKSKKMA